MQMLVGALIGFLALGFVSPAALAQDLTGQWQGVLNAGKEPRFVMKIARSPQGNLNVELYSIDELADAIGLSDISQEGSTLRFSIPRIKARYEGALSADGQTIDGTWTQGSAFELDYTRTTEATAWPVPPPHKIHFITTPEGVKLEVADWGGAGRPLVLLAGLGGTVHGFDLFAPKLTSKYRVYGVTRRGFGASDKPEATLSNYMSDRLADDVLSVIDALKLDRPVLAGFSAGGQELSSIASRHPEKIAGLIYLDGAYGYAFYAPGNQFPIGRNLDIEVNDLRAKITRANKADLSPTQAAAMLDELLRTDLPRLQAELLTTKKMQEQLAALPQMAPFGANPLHETIIAGAQKYTDLKGVPVLAIYAAPGSAPPDADEPLVAYLQLLEIEREKLIKRFERANPNARVVRLPNADHAVFVSHPEEVIQEMTAFIDGLH